MTFIPGTGAPISLKGEDTQKPEIADEPQVFTAINVKELKNPREPEKYEEEETWYMQLKFWMILGTSLSALFAILAVLNYRFLFLIPLGPYAAYLSWHIRKKINKYAKKIDAFSN